MKVLKMDDTIGMGVYVGETVKDCIRKNGRESILDILKYYDLDENILIEYHYRSLGTHQDNPNLVKKKDKVQVRKTVPVEEFVTTTTLDEEYPDLEEKDYENDYWDTPVLYDPEDDDEFADPQYRDSYKPWIYGRKMD